MKLVTVEKYVHMPMQQPETATFSFSPDQVATIDKDCGSDESTLITFKDETKIIAKGSVSEIQDKIDEALK